MEQLEGYRKLPEADVEAGRKSGDKKQMPPGHKDSGKWASNKVPEELSKRSWQRLAHVACAQWNVVGVDLFEQP